VPIDVVKPGLSTTVQDRGREGYYHVGVPPSGALDQFSLVAANRLVGNDAGAAALEGAYMGPELRFGEDAVVAVCGAEIEPRVNGAPQAPWTSFAVGAGDTLSFGHLRAGARMYIAVSGGIDVPETLGSRSTYALGSLGGLEGRALAARLGVGERVTFERRARGELPAIVADADALVFPVRWREPWGLVPLEAMAAGTPVVASGRGGSGEYLRHERNCLVFDVEAGAAGLAEAVVRLAVDEGLRERLSAGGRETAAGIDPRGFEREVAKTVGDLARVSAAYGLGMRC
jgi:hypothetical protein